MVALGFVHGRICYAFSRGLPLVVFHDLRLCFAFSFFSRLPPPFPPWVFRPATFIESVVCVCVCVRIVFFLYFFLYVPLNYAAGWVTHEWRLFTLWFVNQHDGAR
jgi:hypothetical protein